KSKKYPCAKPPLPSKLSKFWTISASGDHGVTGRKTEHLEIPPAQQQRQDDKQTAHRSGDAVIWQLLQRLHLVENESRERKNLVSQADDRPHFEGRKPDRENINGRSQNAGEGERQGNMPQRLEELETVDSADFFQRWIHRAIGRHDHDERQRG